MLLNWNHWRPRQIWVVQLFELVSQSTTTCSLSVLFFLPFLYLIDCSSAKTSSSCSKTCLACFDPQSKWFTAHIPLWGLHHHFPSKYFPIVTVYSELFCSLCFLPKPEFIQWHSVGVFTLFHHSQIKICGHRPMWPLTHIPYYRSGRRATTATLRETFTVGSLVSLRIS